MFDRFKKKKTEPLYVLTKGTLTPLAEVNDEAFSKGMLGEGYAVEPEDGQVYAPVKGTVENIFPTSHALGLKTASGLEILVHMGIDTVELEGKPFTVHVKVGDKVDETTLLATMDLAEITKLGKDKTVIVVVLNGEAFTKFPVVSTGKAVKPQELIGEIEL